MVSGFSRHDFFEWVLVTLNSLSGLSYKMQYFDGEYAKFVNPFNYKQYMKVAFFEDGTVAMGYCPCKEKFNKFQPLDCDDLANCEKLIVSFLEFNQLNVRKVG
jgi:hypothetical protein